MDILQIFAGYPIWMVIIIAVGTLVGLYRFIVWAKKTWEQREAFKKAAFQEGVEKQRQIDIQAEEEAAEKQKIQTLEANLATLTKILEKQQEQIDLLIQSDELNIKAWIKAQHEKWIALQCIDSQSLELITQRFEIYQDEGGNSWAERLVEDIKALPIITVIPVPPKE